MGNTIIASNLKGGGGALLAQNWLRTKISGTHF